MAIWAPTSRRGLLIAAACLGWIAVAQAQIYPNRPVKIIVPTVAGGTVDVITRLMANDLSARLGASFRRHRSGAGNIARGRTHADGYTLLMSARAAR
jgi:tripartite-type tricarboxylate transporter receptor subunit TctC